MAAPNRMTTSVADPEQVPEDLAAVVEESPDVLLERLKDRFERAIDALLRARQDAVGHRLTTRDILFGLYEEGLLTKAEVRLRGGLGPEEFHDGLHAYRLRTHPQDEVTRSLQALEYSDPDDPENDRFPFNVPMTFSEEEGAEIERILKAGAPAWVLAIREQVGR